jgi:hypothetical protein
MMIKGFEEFHVYIYIYLISYYLLCGLGYVYVINFFFFFFFFPVCKIVVAVDELLLLIGMQRSDLLEMLMVMSSKSE